MLIFSALFFGCFSWTAPAVIGPPSAQELIHNWKGEAPGDRFGAVAYVGDVNTDGFPELLIGAPAADLNGLDSGMAALHSGLDGAVLYSYLGSPSNFHFGSVVGGGGDVDADGVPDFILGAPFADETGVNAGSVYVHSGRDGSLLYRFSGNPMWTFFGSAVANAGDVNADGHDDILVGSSIAGVGGYESGMARVYSGADGSILYQRNGGGVGYHFGISLDGAGDINGDGYDDFVIGAPGAESSSAGIGRAYVYSGIDGSLLYIFAGSSPIATLGHVVAGAGDVNGDGIPDIITGSYASEDHGVQSGNAVVFSGADSSLLYRFLGYQPGGAFGWNLDGAGDVDGDGCADLIVGAIYEQQNRVRSVPGSARVFSGRDGSVLLNLRGKGHHNFFGISVTTAGDMNGDGRDDVAISATDADYPLPDAGQVLVLGLAPPFLTLALEDGNPLAMLRARELRPNAPTWLFASVAGMGTRRVKPLGLILDLKDPMRPLGPLRSDAQGSLTWTVRIPDLYLQQSVWLQMAQVGLKTNVTGGRAFP